MCDQNVDNNASEEHKDLTVTVSTRWWISWYHVTTIQRCCSLSFHKTLRTAFHKIQVISTSKFASIYKLLYDALQLIRLCPLKCIYKCCRRKSLLAFASAFISTQFYLDCSSEAHKKPKKYHKIYLTDYLFVSGIPL